MANFTDVKKDLVVNIVPSKEKYNELIQKPENFTDRDLVIIQGEQTQRLYKDEVNQMSSAGRIRMDTSYTPIEDTDVATKAYVQAQSPTSTVGSTTMNQIYIGSIQPASGTAPLIWIDTTNSTGVLKYRVSTTSNWLAVPVAWS